MNIWSHALLVKNEEKSGTKGTKPFLDAPKAKLTADCSATPTVMNLSGKVSLKSNIFVAVPVSLSITMIFSFSCPSSISVSLNVVRIPFNELPYINFSLIF
jgi:hypothetical protein